ncbi:prolactin-releasing peptide receptor-like [Limulus polyphemus]|uniref:Prolactin-releasing peptide receptor-like n=1 Tax=Limulus polyphemus TaxID=6850 RepID=A0ABM1SZA8_LIMPO|nr:prolactin-releasing peptide receptor-like [Limulus polyphemus]XP_022248963.1 prolactin-releasing peptide receptor-like [Limulus polyphemus]XP_022248964.1 prolactin-releasing peptide receptor-like [Limulus polyphemus]
MKSIFLTNNISDLIGNISLENQTCEDLSLNSTGDNLTITDEYSILEDFTNTPAMRAFFSCLYIIIFVLGICGNVLVCYVVFRNKSMQTVTNYFITNLALSDILLCTFAVPFPPLYIFLRKWVFGRVLCHLVPYAQGVSVYISAFTLMSIAIDRFFVIIYPFKQRLKISCCIMLIILIWTMACLLTLPYGILMKLFKDNDIFYCDEGWPQEASRRVFGLCTSVLQFVVPFIIISVCYITVCVKLRRRARSKPGAKSVKKEEQERERTRRTNRMLIAMVIVFGASWLPLNIFNLVGDFYIPAMNWEYMNTFYFLCHAAAMSSTCYNPFLYAWLNENFRKEFKTVLPCFILQSAATGMINSGKHERNCNGHENLRESLLPQAANQRNNKAPQDTVPSAKWVIETDTVCLQVGNNQPYVV